MSNLFSGLESLGLSKLSDIELFEDENKTTGHRPEKKSAEPAPQMTESDFIFDKSVRCPVCDKEFKTKTVKTGKVKLISADTDLRPKYQLVDSLKYDVIACPNCGYAALNRYFTYMTSVQVKMIKSNISVNFKGLSPEGEIITYDQAITKHKLALVNAIVKRAKFSERAYTCLKTAWIYRGKAETLPQDTKDYDKVIEELRKEELEFTEKAYEGFLSAFSKETFPMCGMDEHTTTYLVADLARRIGKSDDSMRWISKVLTARDAKDRVKTKARELKDILMKEREGE